MTTSLTRSLLLIVCCAWGLAGCNSPTSIKPEPVTNPQPPLPAGVYWLADVPVKPRLVNPVSPTYPAAYKNAGIQGYAIVEFTITEEGKVTDCIVLEANFPLFAASAVQSIERWKFSPGRLDGKPVACRAQQKLDFQLNH